MITIFNTQKFGGYIALLRKKADMTQSELADRLNITRQAVSKYEVGDSFPDVSILVSIAEVFGVTLDELIAAGEPRTANPGFSVSLLWARKPSPTIWTT